MMSGARPLNRHNEEVFLSTVQAAQRMAQKKRGEKLFSQGEVATTVLYMMHGRAKLAVLSAAGKEATIMILQPGDFAGEEALTASPSLRSATASAITACTFVAVPNSVMLRCIHDSRPCSDLFVAFLLRRSRCIQDDLIDHLFNSSEKRLARKLLMLAEPTSDDESGVLLPMITQETLAEMIGTTRSRVNFFMNRFRKLGFIEYRGQIRVNKVRLTSVLEVADNPSEPGR